MRVDFNVPLMDGEIQDVSRLKAAIPSIKKILSENCRSLVLMSHMGRPQGRFNKHLSLEPVAKSLQDLLGTKVQFMEDCIGRDIEE